MAETGGDQRPGYVVSGNQAENPSVGRARSRPGLAKPVAAVPAFQRAAPLMCRETVQDAKGWKQALLAGGISRQLQHLYEPMNH